MVAEVRLCIEGELGITFSHASLPVDCLLPRRLPFTKGHHCLLFKEACPLVFRSIIPLILSWVKMPLRPPVDERDNVVVGPRE